MGYNVCSSLLRILRISLVTNKYIAIYRSSIADDDIVELLLHRGADPGIKDCTNTTAFHYAVQEGNTTIVQQMLKSEKGCACVNQVDHFGRSPLFDAFHIDGNDSLEMIQLLIENGAGIRQ